MPEEKIPVFRNWTQWYLFVLVFLGLLILGFYAFTRYFS